MTPLARELAALIAAEGPISVARYMGLCLGHPRHGYYMTRDPFGAGGDFITAPEISQMFGELVGLWCAQAWLDMGSPSPVRLVELGPGRGTLMADALRAARAVPTFRASLDVHMVEMSPVLRARQQARLADAGVPVSWHADLGDVPDGPAIVIANEFFDALPVAHFVRAGDGWHERRIGLDAAGRLVFGLDPHPARGVMTSLPARPGDILERLDHPLLHALPARLAAQGGAALVIDYGHAQSGLGETLQALREHKPVDPLADPGEADLTAHVDFAALARAALAAGARAFGPMTQGDFLTRLGIEARAARLKQAPGADPAAIDAALARLTGPGPDGMGELFKVLAMVHPAVEAVPGFASGEEFRR
ncbi:class I SAM-dependent methyltransferase [Ancylobacter terrae]|uniref:class I SAM-dependent methyltransferase n=1 Tax=Ancylobacter sp. sgz301288 TaxID=3342077 RepID=UPI00385CAA56